MKSANVETPLPDAKAMLNIERQAFQISHHGIELLLPAVRERLQDIAETIKKANARFCGNVTQGLIDLNLDLDPLGSVATAELDENELVTLRADVQTTIRQVLASVEAVRTYSVPELTELQRTAIQDLQENDKTFKQVQSTVNTREAKLAEIDDSLATLNTPTVRQALRNLIPDDKDIDVILGQMQTPGISPDLIKAAVGKLNTHLDLLEQGREYAKVLAVRAQMADKLKQEQQNLAGLKAQLAQNNEVITQYGRAGELLELRRRWLVQGSLFVDGWSAVDSVLNSKVEAGPLLVALQAARDYLLTVRRRIEAV